MSAADNPSSEHRFLSVLFCDMADSTGHVFSMDAEAYADLLTAYRNIVFESVRRQGGTVARLVGDGVLAYFGWPLASGRDAQAAIACALEITAGVPRLVSSVPITVRIAVETGWLLVGEIGIDQGSVTAIEHLAAVGPAPHVAARLQQFARPNGVIAGEATLRLLGGRFVTEPADTTGIRLPVKVTAAHVLGEAGGGDPLARLRFRGLEPPVGREAELAALRARWALASNGLGQVVLLSGEPGIGKSRLLGAFVNELDTERGIVALFCSAPGRDTPFQPIMPPLRRAMGVDPQDDARQIRIKAVEFARSLNLDDDGHGMALAALLGSPSRDPPPPTILRRQIDEVLLALAGRLARERPLVILAEDAHWADPSTLDLLRTLADWAPSARLLLVVTYRSDHVMAWPDRSHVLRLALSPLSHQSSAELAAARAIALGLSLADERVGDIVKRAEGVPLFVEEFVRALAHGGGETDRLPGSVAQLLTARLDSLGPARPLAHLAAVLGRETPVQLLKALSGMTNNEFGDAEQRLTDTGLMLRRGIGETAILTFRHALLSDAAYNALPSYRRRTLHGVVADTLSRINPTLAANEPEALARHYAAAGRIVDANRLFCDAAAIALSAGAFVEAEAHARRALESGGLLPQTDRDVAVLPALALLGEALIATRGYADPEVQEIFERGARLALAMGNARETLPVLRGLTSFYQVRGPLWMAHQLSERVLQIARLVGEPLVLAQAERRHGWCRMCEGDLAQARRLLEAALARQAAVSDEDAAKELIFDDATTHGTLAWLDWLTEGTPAALARAEQAEARAASSPRPLSAAYAFGFAAIARQLAGDVDGAERLAARCGAIAAARGFIYWTAMAEALRGWSEALRDHSLVGLNRLRGAVADYHRTQSELLRPYLLGLLAEAEHVAGSGVDGFQALDLAEELATAIGARLHLPILSMLRGRLMTGAHALRAFSAARDEAVSQGATALAAAADAELARRQ